MAKIIKLIVIVFAFFIYPYFVNAASNLYINPSSGTYEVGQKISVQIMISGNEPINAVSGNINIPTNIFAIESVSKSNSILNFWVTEPSFSNGNVTFEGVTLGGYSGSTGNVVTINLRAKAQGSGNISISNGQILANDGQGTNVTGTISGGSFSVIPAKITPVEPKIITPKETKPVVEEIKKEIKEEVKIEEPQKKPSLLPPEIILVNKDGRKLIRGTSGAEKSQVLITFESKDGEKIFITGNTDEKGSFEMFVPNSLKRGKYTATAIVIREDITHSYKSNEVKVRVGNIISDIGWQILTGIGFVVLILFYFIYKIADYLLKTKNRRLRNGKEKYEAQEILSKSFKLLEEDLEKTIQKENEKQKIYKNLKQELKEARKVISKEIKDIDK